MARRRRLDPGRVRLHRRDPGRSLAAGPDDPRVDAALLLPELRGAGRSDYPRTLRTFEAVLDDLTKDGHCYRYRPDEHPLGRPREPSTSATSPVRRCARVAHPRRRLTPKAAVPMPKCYSCVVFGAG